MQPTASHRLAWLDVERRPSQHPGPSPAVGSGLAAGWLAGTVPSPAARAAAVRWSCSRGGCRPGLISQPHVFKTNVPAVQPVVSAPVPTAGAAGAATAGAARGGQQRLLRLNVRPNNGGCLSRACCRCAIAGMPAFASWPNLPAAAAGTAGTAGTATQLEVLENALRRHHLLLCGRQPGGMAARCMALSSTRSRSGDRLGWSTAEERAASLSSQHASIGQQSSRRAPPHGRPRQTCLC